MNAGSIWWEQIGTSLRFVDSIVRHMSDGDPAVIHLRSDIPWRQRFYECIDFRRTSFSGDRRLRRLKWENGMNPGEFVLSHLCSPEVQANYWPGKTYAEYLAEKDDIPLSDYFVWITDIFESEDLENWIDFVNQYMKHQDGYSHRAIFVLEYSGCELESKDIDVVTYSVEKYDCFVFSLESVSSMQNTDLPSYQAELAYGIVGRDPELCHELLKTGKKLLQDPVKTALSVGESSMTSEGKQFSKMNEKKVSSAAWNASVVQFFPVIERFRMTITERYKKELKSRLPVKNSNGEYINDPLDLEIGALYFLLKKHKGLVSYGDWQNVSFCREARNLLAHNKAISYDDAKTLLSLI